MFLVSRPGRNGQEASLGVQTLARELPPSRPQLPESSARLHSWRKPGWGWQESTLPRRLHCGWGRPSSGNRPANKDPLGRHFD